MKKSKALECKQCKELYPEGGDGHDGLCPSCADIAERSRPDLLKCPHCGETDPTQFTHWEWVAVRRPILGFNDNGVLEIEGLAKAEWDCCKDEEFHCNSCECSFPIPDMEIDYV